MSIYFVVEIASVYTNLVHIFEQFLRSTGPKTEQLKIFFERISATCLIHSNNQSSKMEKIVKDSLSS